jgi:tetratricopeptide (TPR) repeat protein
VRKSPEAEPVPEVVQPTPEPIVEKDPFKVFPEKFRLQALEAEKNRDFSKALFYWKVVHRFEPRDKVASEKMKALESHLQREADRHFSRGLERFQKNAIQEARREFLLCLTYQPGHAQAMDYLRYKLNEANFLTYETREGDTLKKISREIYRDPDKDFLIAYFNDLEDKNPIKSGLTLKLPVITSIGVTKKTYPEEDAYKLKPGTSSKPRTSDGQQQEQAELHYIKGARYFLAEDLDKAIVEWEEALRLNPEHPNAKRDIEKAKRILKNLRKSP